MDYRIVSSESATDAVRRIAHQETAEALDRLDNLTGGEAVPSIHDCRKRCKKLRGLARLARMSLGHQYREINQTYRDAARELSSYRDAHALLATFDDLVARSTDRLPPGGLLPVRAELADRARTASEEAADGDAEPIDRARRLLVKVRDSIDDWTFEHEGWDVFAGGVAKTYRRGVVALDRVIADPDAHRYHELRKRAKYTRFHVQLLTGSAPSILTPLGETWHSLSDGLGDAHDLAVLEEMLVADPDAFGGQGLVDETLPLLDTYRRDLEQRSVALAVRLYADTPAGFTRRLAGYWDSWEEYGDEQLVSSIAELYPKLDDLDELTVAELRKLATTVSLPNRSSRGRSELIGGLRAYGAVS